MITTRGLILRSIGTFVGLGGLACCLTMLYLDARVLMSIGGGCGPEVGVPCPQGVGWIMPVSILGGIAALGVYLVSLLPVGPRLALLAWPAVFLSLGWAFWEAAMATPSAELGFMICAVVFAITGGLPLIVLFHPKASRGVFLGPEPAPGPAASGPSGGNVRWTTSVVLPGQNDMPRHAVDLDDPPQDRPTYPPQDRPTSPPQDARLRPSSRFAGPSRQDAPSDAVPGDLVGQLERLAVLHRSGHLDDDEYAAAKARLLNGSR
ncbi:hypothetical protein DQ384_34055 [Sphaerisporangium album]|uniref:SHOCT domain-containing protein n=1 Tax=Sphaerisporangium album TaxID=509200 RepID=A0A367F1N6_9ACTN|nr:SHOCT domain-containing protein [Sphaerisporangium album]RCG23390.1 hypothetical protein DQ384_34055 [Sphaerisporangium album]